MSDVLKRRLRCASTPASPPTRAGPGVQLHRRQRDAGHAYIASQRAEGWIPVAATTTTPRTPGATWTPALKRLLADIEAGKVDVVVIYKIDRLTEASPTSPRLSRCSNALGCPSSRSPNSSTPRPRWPADAEHPAVLRQFEREVTGERIRDKIAASKRKGCGWAAYRLSGTTSRTDAWSEPAEAKLVRHIFHRFAELGSSTTLVKELKLDGMTSKAWTTQDGKTREGRPIDKGLIYKLLGNRTTSGSCATRSSGIQGAHPAHRSGTVGPGPRHPGDQRARTRQRHPAAVPYLLKGLVFGHDGCALSRSTPQKNGRRYRYYVPSGMPKSTPGVGLATTARRRARIRRAGPAAGHPAVAGPTGDVLPRAIDLDPPWTRPRSRSP